MRIKCPNCGQEYEVDQSILGCKAQCEKCNSTFVVHAMDNGAAQDVKNESARENRMGFKDLLKQRREALLEEERKKQEEERKKQEEERKRQAEAAIAPHPLRGREAAWRDDYVRGQLVLRGEGKTLDSEGALLRPFAISLGIAPEHFAELEQEVSFYDEQSNSETMEMLLGMLKQDEEVVCFMCDIARLHGDRYAFGGEFLELWRDICMGLFQVGSEKMAKLELLCERIAKGEWRRRRDDFGQISKGLILYYLYSLRGVGNGQYLVIDLSGGANADQYPMHSTNEPPKVMESTCKTSELWLRRIPAGSFTMGSPKNELGHNGSETQHQVTLTQDYFIGVFPCTQRQYELVMGSNPSTFKGANNPVEHVSYNVLHGVGSFFERLQKRTGFVFDLPTEAEWEYACRAGTTTALNSGKRLTLEFGKCSNLDEVGWHGRSYLGGGRPQPVGQKKPNAWGLYDMHGNVLEWCLDWFGDYPSQAVTDPVGATSGERRVLRGGCYEDNAGRCRSASRHLFKPSDGHFNFGFRVALRP